MPNKPLVVYFTRNSIAADLIASQVLPLVQELSQEYRFILITFEKSLTTPIPAVASSLILSDKVEWSPQKFYKSHLFFITILQLLALSVSLAIAANLRQIRIFHARSYIPALVGAFVSIFSRSQLIFDTRALWIRELVSSKKVKENSLFFRTLLYSERFAVKHSSALITLTSGARDYFQSIYSPSSNTLFRVVPTCVDANNFKYEKSNRSPTNPTYGVTGTLLSSWFDLPGLLSLLSRIVEVQPEALFSFCTRDDKRQITKLLPNSLLPKITFCEFPFHQMSEYYSNLTASIMLFRNSNSKVGSFPTRFSESLYCGVPVITNDIFPDVSYLINKYNVGLLIQEDLYGYENVLSGSALSQLLLDPDLPHRCHILAKECLTLSSHISSYRQVYTHLAYLNPRSRYNHPL